MSIKKRKRDGTWFYRFNWKKETYQQYGFEKYEDAKDAENKRIKVIQEGTRRIHIEAGRLSVRDAAQQFYNEYAKNLSGWRNYQPHLVAISKYFKGIRLIDITKAQGKAFYENISRIVGKTISPHTAHHYFTTLKTVINWWIKEKGLSIPNPLNHVKLPTIPKARVRFLYPAEENILTPLIHDKYSKMWPYYFMALETGLREWNLAVMEVNHVDFILEQIFIPDSKTGVSGYIPISERLLPYLKRWAKDKKKTDRILGSYAQDTISHYFTNIVREAKIEDFTFHDLRHTFAYNLLRQGKPIYLVSKLLLHKNVRTTENHYGHLAVADLGSVVNSAKGYVSSVTPKLTPNPILKKAESGKTVDNQL